MLKRACAIFLICLGLFVLPGCWDYQDLDELSLPIVGIYDLAKPSEKNEEKVKVAGIFPVLYPKTEGRYTIVYENGQTVGQTREKRNYYSPETLNVGMLQVGIYGEKLARKGLHGASDILYRAPKVKNTIYMAVLEGGTEALSKLRLKDYPNPGVYLSGLLKTAQKKSFLPTTTLHLYGVQEVTAGKNPVIPLLKMKSNSRIEISGTGIFKKDKLIAKIDLKDTRSLVMLRGLEGEGSIPFIVEKNGEKIDEGSVLVKRSRKVRVTRKGDDFTFFITVKLQGDVIEHSSQKFFIDTKNTMPLEEIEQAVKREIERDCRKFTQRMQEEFKVDCIDVTKYALAKWRKELKDKVEEGFIENVKIVVDVEVKIKGVGVLT